jgi:hypothetical protein
MYCQECAYVFQPGEHYTIQGEITDLNPLASLQQLRIYNDRDAIYLPAGHISMSILDGF